MSRFIPFSDNPHVFIEGNEDVGLTFAVGDYRWRFGPDGSLTLPNGDTAVASSQVRMFRTTKDVTFTGAAGAGAVGTVALYTVTGRVMIWGIVSRCTTDLVSAGGGTLLLGTSDTPGFMSNDETILATACDTGEIWAGGDLNPLAAGVGIGYASNGSPWILEDDDIIITVGTADVTAGVITFDAFWSPFSTGAEIA